MAGFRRILSSWLVICMLITMLPLQIFAYADGTEVQLSEKPCGSCGNELTWVFDADSSTLTISGTGDMWEFSSEENGIICPWAEYIYQIETVVVEENVTSICESAFYHASSLTSVKLEEGLERIGDGAFLGCYALSEITIPESVTFIGEEAFYDCIALGNVNIPASVAYIGENAFEFCWELSGIWVDEGNTTYSSDEFGVLFSKDKMTLIKAPGGLTGAYEIPATVTDTGLYAFEECSVESVVIPGSLTAIGDHMFAHCEELTKVIIQEGVEKIGNYVFSKCGNLKEISIPKSVKTIGDITFNKCDSLSDVYYSGTEEEWQAVAVGESNDCLSKAMIHFTEVQEHEHTFSDWYETKSPTQEEEGEERRDCSGCDAYETRPIEKMPDVSEENRGSCGKNLTWEFDVDTGVLTIGGTGAMDDYFEDPSMIPWKDYYDSITKVVIEEGVTTIGTYAFFNCTELQDISIPDSVTTINVSIYTRNLDRLVIPAGVTELHLAFEENDVKFIEVVPENKAYSSDKHGVLFNKDKTVLECYPGGSKARSYTVPESVTCIKNAAFRDSKNIVQLTLPKGLAELGDLAFCDSWLEEIRFQGTAPKFGYDVFANLYADVYYPTDDETWTEEIIQSYGGKITWLPYPGSGTSGICGEDLTWEFDEESATLTIRGTGEMDNWWTYYEDPVEEHSFTPWHFYLDQIHTVVLEEGITGIGTCAFYNCKNLHEVSLPSTLVTIGDYAFAECHRLKNPQLPQNLIQIGNSAFENCFLNLTEMVIPESVEQIGESAFYQCNGLSKITLPQGLTQIEDYTFAACYALTDVNIPNSVTSIGKGAFSDCVSLTEITLPEGITEISDQVFMDCYELESMTIPESVTKIGGSSFFCCHKLTAITIPKNVTEIGAAFGECNALREIIFTGQAPVFDDYAFWNVTANAYYPAGDQTWTESVMQNYGGNITWIADEEVNVKERLHRIVEARNEMTQEEIRAAVQALDFDELLAAMRCDQNVVDDLVTLGGYSEVTITRDVPIWNRTFHSAAGLALNNLQTDAPVRLDKPNTAVELPDGYDTEHAIHFSVNLDALGDNRELKVPVCLALIAPEEIHPNFQHLFWRNPATNAVEEIPVEAHWGKVGWYLRFTVSSEGDYVMTAPENAVMSGKCGDNLTWRYDDTYTLTISGSGDMYDYDLESSKTPWYSVRENVKHIEIGENVTGIGTYAFYDCRFADKTVFPASVRSIGGYAFYKMDEKVFLFEGDAPEIVDTAFYHAAYSTIYYDEEKQGWETVISGTYLEADDLKWLPIPEQSDSCGEYLTWKFDEATGTLTISGSGEMINTWWPYEWRDELPKFAPWHDYAADIKTVVIDSGVTSVGHFAFFDCVNLTSVSIPESVTFIGCAFVGCDSLKELYIPAGVTDFRYPSNEGICNGLEKIVVSEENTIYSSDEAGMLYNKDQTKLIGCPTGFQGAYTIPSGVTTIGDWAFNACSGLTAVDIPASVTTIGTAAFNGCEKLDDVVIPASVTSVPMWAFYGCAELSEIVIPAGVTKLGSSALAACKSLAAVYFEGDAPEIEYDSFYLTATTAYYPADNTTWTDDVRQNYGGFLDWCHLPLRGDANADGKVDTTDALQLLWHALLGEEYPLTGRGDVTGDGRVTVEDAAYVVWHTLFPELYPLN